MAASVSNQCRLVTGKTSGRDGDVFVDPNTHSLSHLSSNCGRHLARHQHVGPVR